MTNSHLWDLLLWGHVSVPDGIVLPLLIPGCKSSLRNRQDQPMADQQPYCDSVDEQED